MGAWCEQVVERFAPLLSAFDFRPTYEDDETVRFEKPGLFVEVTFDARRSGELDLWIGMIDDLEPPFELADIVRASECPPETAERVQLMQASDPEVVERLLDRAFEALDACDPFGARTRAHDPGQRQRGRRRGRPRVAAKGLSHGARVARSDS